MRGREGGRASSGPGDGGGRAPTRGSADRIARARRSKAPNAAPGNSRQPALALLGWLRGLCFGHAYLGATLRGVGHYFAFAFAEADESHCVLASFAPMLDHPPRTIAAYQLATPNPAASIGRRPEPRALTRRRRADRRGATAHAERR